MRLGLLTAILPDMDLYQAIDFASENGLECLEVACWPSSGGAKRRYAGVCHIDAEALTEEKAREINDYCAKKHVVISSLGYYPNTLDPDPEKRKTYVEHIHALIDASALLGAGMVTTFFGRDPHRTVAENLELSKEVWPSLLSHAEEKNVRIAIENCPMWFTDDEWPGGQNLMTSPANWRKIFALYPSRNLGINYDPSHFVWQQIDYVRPIYEFRDRIFHFHFKDIHILKDKLADVGIMANPLEYMEPKLPCYGDIDWGKCVAALTDIGYQGNSVIEIEDKAFEKTAEDTVHAIRLSARYLRNFV